MRSGLIVTMLFLSIVILTIVHAVVANQLSTSGVGLSQLYRQIQDYKKENTLLKEDVLNASSFTNIQKRAAIHGYDVSSSYIVVSSPLPIAYNR